MAPPSFMQLVRTLYQRWIAKPADVLQQAYILQHVSDAIIVTDLEFHVQSWNKAAEKMYGWREDEVIGKMITDVVRPQYSSPERTKMLTDLATNRYWSGEIVHLHRDDTPIDVFASITLLRDHTGQRSSVVNINRNITHLKQNEQHKLNLALERERIGMLQIFMSDVAHDIRTPLAAMKLSLYLMEKAKTPQDHQRHMRSLQAQTKRLEKLVDDLFDIARLDRAATNEYHVGWLDVNALVTDVITAHEAFAEEKNLTITFEPDPATPAFLGDANSLERALTNLLMNALNYTPERGIITVRTCLCDMHIVIEIRDTGIGISPEDLPYIFDRFYRADKARGTAKGGLGLGLTIAQRIIEAHGGAIDVRSVPGTGSTFTIKLPLIYAKELNNDAD